MFERMWNGEEEIDENLCKQTTNDNVCHSPGFDGSVGRGRPGSGANCLAKSGMGRSMAARSA